MTKAEKKELTKTYDDCLAGDVEYRQLSVRQDDELINKGWIEALEYVFNLEKRLKEKTVKKGFTRVQAKFRQKGK